MSTISMLIKKLSEMKEQHGDVAVCLIHPYDERVGYIPILGQGVSMIEVSSQNEDGVYEHCERDIFAPPWRPLRAPEKIVVIR